MEKLKNEFQKYLSDFFGRSISIISIREIPGGFLSRAYVLSCSDITHSFELFSRTINSKRGGYVYSLDRYRAFILSDQMYGNANMDIKSYGVMIYRDGENVLNSDFSDTTQFFHIQDFKVSNGLYFNEYISLAKQESLTTDNVELLRKIATKISYLHTKNVTKNLDNSNLQDLYVRGYRELLINPELTFDVLSQFGLDHPYFGAVSHKYDYIKNMHQEYDRMIQFSGVRNLSFLHGDFWPSNILIDNSHSPFFIDYSRIPFGDAGIDIGWFVGNFMLEYIKTKNKIYIDASVVFIDEYKERTADVDILKHSVLSLFWLGIINIFPPVFSDKDPEIMKEILVYINMCFQKGELIIEDLYL